MDTSPSAAPALPASGASSFARISLSFFAAGFVTFITLYDVQPLLPVFSREFNVTAATGSLPLSVATAALAVGMLLAGTLSETVGRKPVMTWSLFLTSLLAMGTPFSRSFTALVTLRLAQGAVLAGLPAVAMAYLGEEIEASSLGAAMGLYIGGNAVGGMTGRIYTAAVTEYSSWRAAIGSVGVICLLLSVYFMKSLPPSRNFRRREFNPALLAASLRDHLKDPVLLGLYGLIFTAMGAFVTTYNYITFDLLSPPYRLSHTSVSFIFLVYLLGSCSSTLVGHLARRFGRTTMILLSLSAMVAGIAVTLSATLSLIIAGIALFTCGFFGAHSVASSWVSTRARTAKAQASSLYLFSYYIGSSISGTAGGIFWSRWGWSGVAAMVVTLLTVGLLATLAVGSAARGENGCSGREETPATAV